MKHLFFFCKLPIYIALHYPLAFIVFFYSYVIRARLALNRWPMYNYPDPKSLGFDEHYDFVSASSDYILYSILVVSIYGVVCIVKKKNLLQIKKWNFYLFFIYIVLLLLMLPTDSVGWFVD